MKTYTSSQKRDAAHAVSFGRGVYSAVLAMIFVFVAMSFVGCTPEAPSISETPPDNGLQTCFDVPPIQSDSKLIGTWESSYDEVFTITESSFSNGGSWGEGYAGKDLYVYEFDGGYGYIYFVYTRAANPDWTYSEDAPDVGKWYCVAYKNLSDGAVAFSAAYKDGGKTSAESLEEAVKEFTVENGYFGMYSECVKK